MPVLIEAINVIVRNETIEEKYPGGMRSYWVDSPNESTCSDDYVTRVGFLELGTFREFTDRLMELGFRFVENDEMIDIAVFDQEEGMLRPCRWLHVGDHPDGFQYATLRGDLGDVIEKPVGWRFEGSIAERGRVDHLEIFDKESRMGGLDAPPVTAVPEPVPISAESIEAHRRSLFAVHGDAVRWVWCVERDGDSYLVGDLPVSDVPELQVDDPLSCFVILPEDNRDRFGIVLPVNVGGSEGLSPPQRFALTFMPQLFAVERSAPSHRWWNPLDWCRRWMGTRAS